MMIIKSDGRVEEYKPEKVLHSIKRSGLSTSEAEKVLKHIEPQLKDDMSTEELYSIVYSALRERGEGDAGRYDLKKAILRLGPAGFRFENYVAAVLRSYGYKTQNPDQDLHGSCVYHEVDAIAEKDGKRIFIEAKFRNDFRGNVNLKDTMATWARFLDLVDGSAIGNCPHFDEPWIMTNGRFSDRSREFGTCKGMKLVGWKHPKEKTFAMMIDEVGFYPVTTIPDLKTEELDDMAAKGIMLCKDLSGMESDELSRRIDVSEERAGELIQQASQICK